MVVIDTVYEDAFGAKVPVKIDTAGMDPETFHGECGRVAINNGIEGDVHGWEQVRYTNERKEWDEFKASGKSVDEWLHDPDPWWDGLTDAQKEEQIYWAGQRISKTYEGNPYGDSGNPNAYPPASPRPRWEAEERLGKAHEQVYS